MVRRASALAIALALAAASCYRPRDDDAGAADDHVIPRATGAFKIDGEWNEPDWTQNHLRGQFLGFNGKLSRPTSEIRLVHDDRDVFVGLYAADDNIQSGGRDVFALSIGELVLRIDATGKVYPPTPGVRAAADTDGTIDDPRNFDEEWRLEIAIPRELAGLESGKRVELHAARCDTPKQEGIARCGSWSGTVEAD